MGRGASLGGTAPEVFFHEPKAPVPGPEPSAAKLLTVSADPGSASEARERLSKEIGVVVLSAEADPVAESLTASAAICSRYPSALCSSNKPLKRAPRRVWSRARKRIKRQISEIRLANFVQKFLERSSLLELWFVCSKVQADRSRVQQGRRPCQFWLPELFAERHFHSRRGAS